jgi:hypothetical protein
MRPLSLRLALTAAALTQCCAVLLWSVAPKTATSPYGWSNDSSWAYDWTASLMATIVLTRNVRG